jgi:DHA1 family bicyclomycin/chloramphenicol resistance-like MFS transporter
MNAPTAYRPSVLLLGAASGLSPFGVTITVPLLLMIAVEFQATTGQVQFLISAYLFGLATAQPFNGYLCDRFGRRPVLLGGFALFIVASLLASRAEQLEALIVLRFLQAVGVSVGTVASRAVVRDTNDARGATEALAYIAAAMGFAPILAPIAGGWLGASGGWQSVFIATALLGAAIWTWIFFALPETLRPDHEKPRLADGFGHYAQLLGTPAFLGYTFIFGFVQGCFFAFLAVGAAVFEQQLGIGEAEFGLWWGGMAVTYVIGAMVSGRLFRVLDLNRVMDGSVLLVVAGGLLAPLLVWHFGISMATVLVPLGFIMVAAGTTTPGALAGAVNLFPQMAGTASGLSSSVGIVVGGVFTVLGGLVYEGDYLPVTGLIAGSAVLTALSWITVRLTTSERETSGKKEAI